MKIDVSQPELDFLIRNLNETARRLSLSMRKDLNESNGSFHFDWTLERNVKVEFREDDYPLYGSRGPVIFQYYFSLGDLLREILKEGG